MEESEYAAAQWRTGRTVGRTIYAMRGSAPSDTDPLIGVMDTPELARVAVSDHNIQVNYFNERNGVWIDGGTVGS
jgi:hypothetical protein